MFTGNFVCTSFKNELLQAIHNFTLHTFKIALYTNSASLNAATTAYSATNEAVGTNYTAGGVALAGAAIADYPDSYGNQIATVTFTNPVFANVTLTFRGALIYNSSAANRAVMVLDFGADKTYTAAAATIQMPPVDAQNALLRL